MAGGILTRRGFLKVGGLAAGAAIIPPGLFKRGLEGGSAAVEPVGASELQQLIEETLQFRQQLGFDGLPEELVSAMANPLSEPWEPTGGDIKNELPLENRPYGEYGRQIVKALFGPYATKLIRGVRQDPYRPDEIHFEPETRWVDVYRGVRKFSFDDFLNRFTHELGHGTDPKLFPSANISIPLDTLVHVAHGKWQALTRTFAIKEEFFHNPGDLMYPVLKQFVGKSVGEFFAGLGGDMDIARKEDLPLIRQVVSEVAQAHKKSVHDLLYTKQVCREIGERLIALQMAGSVHFDSDLKVNYQNQLDGSLVEIYAEMVRYALLHPEDINQDRIVLSGITEVLSALRGEPVILPRIRKTIETQGSELSRHANTVQKQKSQQTTAQSEFSPQIGSAVQKPATAASPDSLTSPQGDLFAYVKQGEIPQELIRSLPTDIQTTITTYVALYGKMLNAYPGLEGMNSQYSQFNMWFDPELHMWETEGIEWATERLNVDEMVAFIKSGGNGPPFFEKFFWDSKIAVLEKFVNSPAFGTNASSG